jgi:hypothetical protein
MASNSPPTDDEVRWAYEVSNRVADVAILQVIADVDANFTLTDEQIAFMNSPEAARARAICDRHQKACGIGPIDLEAGRRLPKHDLADMEAERPDIEVAEADGPVPARVADGMSAQTMPYPSDIATYQSRSAALFPLLFPIPEPDGRE